MSISAAQCRAARALLNLTQDQLAKNAQVARATIADFERNTRFPIGNNMVSIMSALEAAGIEFLDDNGGGVGVRRRKVELEYDKTLRCTDIVEGATLRVRYRKERYDIRIPRMVIEDMHHTTYGSVDKLVEGIELKFPIFLQAAENAIIQGNIIPPNLVFLSPENFPEGTFN